MISGVKSMAKGIATFSFGAVAMAATYLANGKSTFEMGDGMWLFLMIIICLVLIGLAVWEYFWNKRLYWALTYVCILVVLCLLYYLFALSGDNNTKAK